MKTMTCTVGNKSIVVAIAGWLFVACNAFAQYQPSPSNSDYEAPHFSTNAPPAGFATRWDYVKSFTTEKGILKAYQTGLLNKDECLLAMGRLGNDVSMDTYGQVVDQNGEPIAGVKVWSHLEVGIGDYEERDTTTDVHGKFQYRGLHGQALIMHFKKEGYDFDERLLPERPKDYLPVPGNPLIITMWKQRGAEPMRHDENFYKVPADGRPVTINFKQNKKIDGTNAEGDLFLRIQRPDHIKRGEKFDWRFSMTAVDGGLIEATNFPYLNEAPADGYQPAYELNMSSADTNWLEEITKTFFFKTRNGNVYGHFCATVTPNYNDVSVLEIEAFVNPSGSRNLEFDRKKLIR